MTAISLLKRWSLLQMFAVIRHWYQSHFTDPDAVALLLLLLFGFSFLWFFGALLGPFLLALALAYLLEWPLSQMQRLGLSRPGGTSILILLFISGMLLIVTYLLPILVLQGVDFAKELPDMLGKAKELVRALPERYPELINISVMEGLFDTLRERVLELGKVVVTASLHSLISVVSLLIYAVLVPMLLFFMLKDKQTLLDGMQRFLPRHQKLTLRVWSEMNQQLKNYIRGKAVEILVVAVATYIPFWWMELRYALLLTVAVGLSVLVPYIGAVVVTIPVTMVALFQFGISPDFFWLMLGYGVIQALDGNILVPLLFSEAVNMHPVAIIVAVLFFGGLWGFWGIFFAIPLAALVKAVLNAWPTETSSDFIEQH